MKLNLGCGAALKPGWTNIDIEAIRLEGGGGVTYIRHDLTKGLPNNIKPDTVDFVHTEHFLEHITRPQAVALLKNVHAVLKPGGVLRLSVPNLEIAVADYLHKNITRIKEVWRPETPCQMLNESMRSWGHQFMYDMEELFLVLRESGFPRNGTASRAWRRSNYYQLSDIEIRPYHGEIIVEAVK